MGLIVSALTGYLSNGEQAWELADTINGTVANYEAIFHSVGDRSMGAGANKGDTDIWVYLHRVNSSTYRTEVAQDYSPTDGVWIAGSWHRAAGLDFLVGLVDADQIDWWCVVNEYEFHFYWHIGATWNSVAFGIPYPTKVAGTAGIGRLVSQSGTGNGVIIEVDRDLTATVKAGQPIWLVNQTPDGQSVQSVDINIVSVVSVFADRIVVDGVVDVYAVGSLVGYDPAANFCRISGASNNYCTCEIDGTWTGIANQAMQVINSMGTWQNEGDNDPDFNGIYSSAPIYLRGSGPPKKLRGVFQHLRVSAKGAQVNGSITRLDMDDASKWVTFITQPAGFDVSNAMLLGPGAGGAPDQEGEMLGFPPVAALTPGSPGVASVVSLTPTTVKVTFDVPALDNAALRSVSSYTISPTLDVKGVTPEAVANPTYVVLDVTEQTTGVAYTMTLVLLKAA